MFKLFVISILVLVTHCDNIPFKKSEFLKKSLVDVCAKCGCIRGKVESGRKMSYEAFYGIPYAEPPLGELRLENPLPHRGWSGTWNATYPRDDCIQRNVFLYNQPIVGSEDCLYLNVYRPVEQKVKLPVFVYIHGGGFMTFSSKPGFFGPEYIMDTSEVILVTMNYRLGMFGFLCSGDGAVKGNFGLKDQQLALKWIAANIESFGGDPYSVTLAGQSVGAVSTQYHMMNPISQNLFHRAMVISGSINGFWAFGDDAAENFRLSSKYSGLKNWRNASNFQLAEQMKKLDALSLILAHDELFLFAVTPLIPLRPCIEGNWEGAFLRENPRKVWAEGRFPQKPILFSVTTNEGTFASSIPTNRTLLDTFNENIYKLLPHLLDFDAKYVSDVLKFYLGEKDYFDFENPEPFYQMYGDRVFVHPVATAAKQYLRYTDTHKNPIYIHEFGFTGRDTVVKYLTGKDINVGVSHLDDMIYLFTMKDLFPPFEPDTPEGQMSEVFVQTLVNFIVNGEVKAWADFEPCTLQNSKPFCDYQAFSRCKKLDLNSVLVTVTNKINLKMTHLWDKISFA